MPLVDWLPCAACRRRVDPVRAAILEQLALGDDHFDKGECPEALTAYSKAISLRSSDSLLWLRRAAVYERLDDWQQALRDAGRAAQLDERSEAAALAKARALRRLGKTSDALAECRRALQTAPRSGALARLETELAEAGRASAKPAQNSATPSAVSSSKKPELAAKPQVKNRSTDIDYSKWAKLEDSDDEAEGAAGAGMGNRVEDIKPSQAERLNIVENMLEVCRQTSAEVRSYFGEASQRSTAARLPPDHNAPVGIMTPEQLAKHSCSHNRMLVSIYGDIYDVSSRPDLYGYGPRSTHSGHDITWATVLGKETAANFDRFYDVFKLDEEHLARYLRIICQRMVCFDEEFGHAVGRLKPFVEEWRLPAPPTDEIEECKQQ